MVKLTIDNMPVEVPEGTTILNAAKSVGVFLPTLCYMKDINDIRRVAASAWRKSKAVKSW
jgi:NADH-quinone oxidoreductase subunit G